jgi:transposase
MCSPCSRNDARTWQPSGYGQLHAQLRDLVAGGATTDLTATTAAAVLLRRLRPRTAADRARRDVARDVIAEVRQVDKRLAMIAASMADALEQTATGLTDIDGIGPVLASRLIGRTRRASRFPGESAYSSYACAAPVDTCRRSAIGGSGPRARHRLPRSGDRQLNSMLHLNAVTQVRMCRRSEKKLPYNRKLRHDRHRIAARRGRAVGKVAAARKLLTLVYYGCATATSAASTAPRRHNRVGSAGNRGRALVDCHDPRPRSARLSID